MAITWWAQSKGQPSYHLASRLLIVLLHAAGRGQRRRPECEVHASKMARSRLGKKRYQMHTDQRTTPSISSYFEGEHSCTVGGPVNDFCHYGKRMVFPEKLEIEVSHGSDTLLLGVREGSETGMLKKYLNLVLTIALVTRARTEPTGVVTNGEWREKLGLM